MQEITVSITCYLVFRYMAKQHIYTNRLINEKSPYLLQHAHNPVDWYPWEEEAFSTAKAQNKPIFLSIGYATCHWCHTMEHESFEDEEIAELLNDAFINIKVDREEHPEVDSLYMEFAQSMMAGAAGWPLNVILTPELKPFFAATYLPPRRTEGLMGLEDLILRIREVWNSEEHERIELQAEKIVEVFAESVHIKGEELPRKNQISDTTELLYKMADPVYGGMKGVPKFPIGYQSNFLLRYSSTMSDSRALFLAERTLDMMYRGGIYDHLGGGFHRYSIDEKWLVPHFEKMLYDNALLAHTYLEAWQTTKRDFFREISEDILNYILRDMTHTEGGFFSAQDADTEGEEGYFYTWDLDEVKSILSEQESHLFCDYYNITENGNFEGRNILNTPSSFEEFAQQKGEDPEELKALLAEQKEMLWQLREKREHPFTDDKILSSWNGLMIYSMAEAGAAFGNSRYIDAAIKAAQFIRSHMWQENQLFRRWRDGEAQYSAGLEEYAFLIRGLLSLFEIDRGSEWLAWAMHMTNLLTAQFKAEVGGFYQTDGTDPYIILRRCQFSDGAEPSGNAIHCENLLRLYKLTYETSYLRQAEDILRASKQYIDTYSPGYSFHMMNLNHYFDKKAPTIVVALNENNEQHEEIKQAIYTSFIPHKAVIWRNESDEKLLNLLPFAKEQVPMDGKTTIYICHDKVCEKPLTELTKII